MTSDPARRVEAARTAIGEVRGGGYFVAPIRERESVAVKTLPGHGDFLSPWHVMVAASPWARTARLALNFNIFRDMLTLFLLYPLRRPIREAAQRLRPPRSAVRRGRPRRHGSRRPRPVLPGRLAHV